jgi:hypothetical protein
MKNVELVRPNTKVAPAMASVPLPAANVGLRVAPPEVGEHRDSVPHPEPCAASAGDDLSAAHDPANALAAEPPCSRWLRSQSDLFRASSESRQRSVSTEECRQISLSRQRPRASPLPSPSETGMPQA